MPKVSVIQTDFGAGEVSPLVYGRVDTPRYKTGLDKCLNYLPALQGPLYRRPGTKYLNNVKDSTKAPVFIPFQFSITQAYVLELGDLYMRFYANNGQVLTSGASFQVSGNRSDDNDFPFGGYGADYFPFTATRVDTSPQALERISASTSITSGSILELVTPYAFADLSGIRWTQSADTLYLTHPKYPPYKLQRFGQTLWTLKQIYFQDGPYLALNSYSQPGDSTRITFTTAATGPVMNILTGPILTVSAMATNAGAIKVTTSAAHGLRSGDKVYIAGATGTVEANTTGVSGQPFFWNIIVNSTTTFTLVGSTFVHAWISGGTVAPALFPPPSIPTGGVLPDYGRAIALIIAGVRYWGVITDWTNMATVTMNVDASNVVPDATLATAWLLGVYSNTNGYPSCCCLHQSRFVLAAPPNYPQQLDGSEVGNFESFVPSDPATLTVNDSNAYQFTLASQDVNALRWMKSNAQGLLAGSYTSEWLIAASTQGIALTPTNVNAVQTSAYGSSNADAIPVGTAALYISRANRKVREMNYFWQAGTFRSTDLTELSEHITLPMITKIVNQKETQPVVWGVRSDGLFLAMVYDRDDVALKAGWARQQLGGQSDSAGTNPIVLDMAVIPAPDISFDQLWMLVKRFINGQTVVTVEFMTKIFDDTFLQEDSYHFDCGITFDNPVAITAITTASPAVVTAAAHGFANGDQVKLTSIVGLNLSTTDVNGNVTKTNLVNEKTFVVASSTTNTFALNDYSGNPVSSDGFSSYVTGGQVRKLVTHITGLTWLENETVSILADGGIHPDVVVSNTGGIVLQWPAAKVQIGYNYNSDGKLMRLEAGSADGTSIGKTRRPERAAFMLHRVGDFAFGTDFNNLLPIEFARADVQQADQAPPLFSGIVRDGVESAYDFEGQICFRQNTGLPGLVNSVTVMEEVFDV